MTTENQSTNPYAAALADLRKKRAEIDNTIKVLEAMSGLKLADIPSDPSLEGEAAPAAGVEVDAGAFLGMSIADAAMKLLGMRKRQMGNVEIAKEIVAGGLVMNSKDPVNTVGSVLTRRFNQVGDVVRVGRGTWGLKEWYPNRSFKPAQKTDNEPQVSLASDISDLLGEDENHGL